MMSVWFWQTTESICSCSADKAAATSCPTKCVADTKNRFNVPDCTCEQNQCVKLGSLGVQLTKKPRLGEAIKVPQKEYMIYAI